MASLRKKFLVNKAFKSLLPMLLQPRAWLNMTIPLAAATIDGIWRINLTMKDDNLCAIRQSRCAHKVKGNRGDALVLEADTPRFIPIL